MNRLTWLLAQITTGSGGGEVNIPRRSISELLKNGLNIVYFVIGIVAVIMMS
jgi:hypothetical protein